MKLKFIFVTFLLFIFSFNCFSFEQDFNPKENLTVGDRATLSIKANGLNLNTIDKENLSKINFGDFELIDIQQNQNGGIDLILSTFKAGKVELLSADIYYKVNDQTKFIKTQALPIEVKSVLDPQKPSQDIQDIKGILVIHHSLLWFAKVILLILIIILAISALVIYLLKNKNKKPTPEEIILAIPPKDYAFSQLEKLKSANLIEKGQIKDYYDTLSDILRYYVSRVYKIDGLEKTTKELFALLKDKIELEDNRALRNFLINCDFVKFAKVVPTTEQTQEDFNQTKGFIEKL